MTQTTSGLSLRIVDDPAVARETVLKRAPLGSPRCPRRSSARSTSCGASPRHAAEHVARILAGGPPRGRRRRPRFTERFDGSSYEAIEVTPRRDLRGVRADHPEDRDAITVRVERVRRYHETQLEHAPPLPGAGHGDARASAAPRRRLHDRRRRGAALLGDPHRRARRRRGRRGGDRRDRGACGRHGEPAEARGRAPRRHEAHLPRLRRAGDRRVRLRHRDHPAGRQDLRAGRHLRDAREAAAVRPVGIDAIYGPTETLVLADDTPRPNSAPPTCSRRRSTTCSRPRAHHPQPRPWPRPSPPRWRRSSPRSSAARSPAPPSSAAAPSCLETSTRRSLLADEFAPEHLCLLVEEPEALLPLIRCAGGVFLGESSPEVLGDYTAGPSHVMPTGGSARFASPLSVLDFLKVTSVIALSEEDLVRLGSVRCAPRACRGPHRARTQHRAPAGGSLMEAQS
jgi:histidinol dehydrogenase